MRQVIAALLIMLWLWASPAQATIFYEETFEAVALGYQPQDENINGVLWDTYQGPAGYVLGTIANSPLTAPEGSRYIFWHTNCLSGYVANRCYPGNDETLGTHDVGIQIFPSGFTLTSGTTYYFGAFFRFDRVSSRAIFNETGSPGNSWNKTFEISGAGTRWGMGIGWPQNYTVTAGKFTADLWCSSGSYAWCTTDHPVQNQNGYAASTPYLMDYERWYAVVIGITMHTSGASGRMREWVNGTLIMDYTQQTMDAAAVFEDHWLHSTIAQASPGYDAPEHYIYTDHLLFTDSLTTVTDAGLMSDPEAGGGSSPATRIFPALSRTQWLELAIAIVGLWHARSSACSLGLTIWRYASTVPSPRAWYCGYRYRHAVKRWKREAPLMLPAPPVRLEVPATKKERHYNG